MSLESGEAAPVRDAVPVVAIGASAGGLAAVTRLLRSLPPDTGCAFVVIQHLDATHPSALSELLGRATDLPVAEAADKTPVVANRVYVLPPNASMTITGRVLHLAPRDAQTPHLPIDRFLRSLASDCGPAAVGIILSGTGTDGTAGLIAVKDAGGMTFAQDASSAEFAGMPTMAAAAGGAEAILSPERIAVALVRLGKDPDFGLGNTDGQGQASPAGDADHLRAICTIMHEATGTDFSRYRETMVLRRVLRRLAIRNLGDLDAYARLLTVDASERADLQRDLLIGVTSFFRDAEAFDALETLVLPALLRDRTADATIRIWVAGCASGEEAYSILMVLREYQLEHRTAYPVQMFASDLSDAAIDVARSGKYAEHAVAGVSAARLRQHFTKVDGAYQIIKALREQCVFSRHNLLDDPPFSRLDLISCRNVLIYLDSVQRRIIPLFHYALVDRGFLMLGSAETTHHADLFLPIDPRQRIYAKRPASRKPYESFLRAASDRRVAVMRGQSAAPTTRRPSPMDVSRSADHIIASRYGPSGVLVDESLQVLEVKGHASPLLALTAGRASLHLVKHLPDTGLYLEVERLVRAAAATGATSRAGNLPYRLNDRAGAVDVEVTPLESGDQPAFLVLFEMSEPVDLSGSAPTRPPARNDAAGSADRTRIAQLEGELALLRARLVSLVDEQERRDEGHQQIAEDALSATEELQSLTEELETAKEELQSTNEELLTLNRELESRNRALLLARDLAKATVETVGVPLVVIDTAAQVRHVNAAFGRTFDMEVAGLEGQNLFDMCGGAWKHEALRRRVDGLRRDHKAFDRLEVEGEFPGVGSRVLLVSGCPLEEFELILLTIEDVTLQRRAERALHRSEEQRRQGEKMEVVGRLAGGIAHDFNNLLTIILGNTSFIVETLGSGHEVSEHAIDIRQAAERAAALTDQLLSFSRRKVLQPKVFDLNPLVLEFNGMLRRLLPERIEIVVRTSDEACLVKADPAEIGRVVMNLCVNARDAMPGGGVLTVATDHVEVTTAEAAGAGVSPGRHVRLTVTDTGVGMDAETRRQAFEPFFTTKDASKGAGLGLASAFGILKQSGGGVTCESEPGLGTTFALLLPAEQQLAAPPDHIRDNLTLARAGASNVVLLVEDDDGVRQLTRRILDRCGYVVLEARNGKAALALVGGHAGQIDLLVSDVMMPEMGGGELARRATALRPSLRVLFVSGHTDDVTGREGVTRGMAFLQKPFSPAALTRTVREVLDAGPG